MSIELRDRVRGCLLGGAIGDALGYPIEFMGEGEIRRRFGEQGISTLAQAARLDRAHVALFSDDTQMTLFTAAGLLRGMASRGLPEASDLWLAYREWLCTQGDDTRMEDPAHPRLWLTSVEGLHSLRAPGNTCLLALRHSDGGSPEQPVNNSKGCGGVMRVAPIGLVAGARTDWAMSLGAQAAALTHGHPLGWLSAAALAHMVASACANPSALRDVVLGSARETAHSYAAYPQAEELRAGIRRAVELADGVAGRADVSPDEERDLVHELGEGWVGEEALYIAVYAALAHVDDVATALRVAVNHKGDSDSTGAVCGSLLGAQLGARPFEQAFDLDVLEQCDLLERMADELCAAMEQESR